MSTRLVCIGVSQRCSNTLTRDQPNVSELMTELLQAPLCDRHGCQKVRINDRRRREGWFWRCRQCNNESRRRAYNKNIRGNEERMDADNEYQRDRYAANEAVRRQVIERTTQYREENRDHLNAKRRQLNAYQRNYDKARWARLKHEQTWERIKRTYGVTQAQYKELLSRQGGCCAICKSTDPKTKRIKHVSFFVDHCHQTGAVRGLLCHPCNAAIGFLGDDTDRLRQAAAYLNGGNQSLVDAVLHSVDEGHCDGAA